MRCTVHTHWWVPIEHWASMQPCIHSSMNLIIHKFKNTCIHVSQVNSSFDFDGKLWENLTFCKTQKPPLQSLFSFHNDVKTSEYSSFPCSKTSIFCPLAMKTDVRLMNKFFYILQEILHRIEPFLYKWTSKYRYVNNDIRLKWSLWNFHIKVLCFVPNLHALRLER